jgi:hypothetical protein
VSKKIAEAIEAGMRVPGEEMSIGLSSTTRAQSKCRSKRRNDVWCAVLDGQDLDQTPEMIAAKSAHLSKPSVQESELAATLLAISIRQDTFSTEHGSLGFQSTPSDTELRCCHDPHHLLRI